ncbi:Uncharacterized protein GY17_00000651 [Cryptosporidium hominis]|uniref:Uncharacterized protein n=1 Tax=Cryptosporidium hominis TaxID=237895 RepID=A0ABX5BI97_CRYHO|nr:Uncharacterized protein GY17_00000651 [Cryptosporidium hominis]|eukprot:PPS98112.1 Uncharacterized protein GY17_00000651 [Cryptosporidium hominis]
MDELHPLFRNNVPSTSELKSNEIYSALVEISAQKVQDTSTNENRSQLSKVDKNSSKISVLSKGINKTHNSERYIKGRYQRHLDKIKATKSRMEQEKSQDYLDNITSKNHQVTDDHHHDQQVKELAEMELCMSIWSNKNIFSE